MKLIVRKKVNDCISKSKYLSALILSLLFYQTSIATLVDSKNSTYNFHNGMTTYGQRQDPILISGKVVDGIGNPIEAATVSVFEESSNSAIKSIATNKDGKFELSITEHADLLIEVSAVGMESTIMSISTKNEKVIELPVLKLSETLKNLDEVTVTAKQPTIELRNDRIVYNLSNSITTVGNDALQALKRAPGVAVSSNDQISLKGNTSVQVMLNGRLTYFSGNDLASFLKSIPASNIEAIEIITNPSAKFDAAGTAGIINIKLKKNQKLGFNGNANVNGLQGYTFKFNGTVEGNYRSEKSNIYGSYGYEDGTYETKTAFLRQQQLNNTTTFFDQNSLDEDNNKAHSYKVGVDFFLNEKNTIGFLWNGSNRKNNDVINGSTAIFTDPNNLDSVLSATNDRLIKSNNNNFNANYQYLDTNGREFTANLNYIQLDRRERSYQPNIYTDRNGNETQPPLIYYIDAPTNLDIYVANLDYKQNLLGGELGIGGKMSYVRTKNDFNNYRVIENEHTVDPDLTNFFTYKERINAAYINYNITLGKFTYQAGLRGEQTISEGDLTTLTEQGQEHVKRDYFNLFPSASILYKKNDDNSFSLNYSRRIQRPNYQNLNPFQIRQDELTFYQGNPFLNAEYSDNLEVNYSWKQFILASFSYLKTSNVVSPITTYAENKRILSSYQNIGENDSYTISLSSNVDVTKWWNVFINANLYYQKYNGSLVQGPISNSATTFSVNGQSTFTMTPTLTGEISFFYRTPEVYGILRNSSAGQIDLGLRKMLFNDRASIRVACSDVFHMLKLTSRSIYDGMNIVQKFQPESRVFTLGFSYKFGGKNVEKARQRSVGSEEESRRF